MKPADFYQGTADAMGVALYLYPDGSVTNSRKAGIEHLLAVGDLATATVEVFGPQATHFTSVDALVSHLLGEAESGDTILVKGSRFMRMERVVAALVGEAEAKAH